MHSFASDFRKWFPAGSCLACSYMEMLRSSAIVLSVAILELYLFLQDHPLSSCALSKLEDK